MAWCARGRRRRCETAGTGQLRVFGNGRNRICFSHVDNYAHGLIIGERALTPGSPALGKFYIVTDGSTHTDPKGCVRARNAPSSSPRRVPPGRGARAVSREDEPRRLNQRNDDATWRKGGGSGRPFFSRARVVGAVRRWNCATTTTTVAAFLNVIFCFVSP
jgi:hypothetical protein